MRDLTPVEKVKKGEIITAKYLNKVGTAVNTLTRAVSPPKQKNQPVAAPVQNQSAEEAAEEAVPPSDYVESSRTTSTVLVYDDAEQNYAEVSRIDSVSFANSNGDTLVLRFNNT